MTAAISPEDHVHSDLCHAGKETSSTDPQPVVKATISPIPISTRDTPRDIIAMYARRTASSGWTKPRVTTTGPVVPVLFGRALHVNSTTPIERAPSGEVMPVAADDPAPDFRTRHRALPRVRIPECVLHPVGGLRRLMAAAFVVAIVFAGFAQHSSAQERYVVRDGDTLEGVASEFGVDPDAILSSSYLADPPNLQPGEVIIVPDPGQSPDEAAAYAAAHEGSSPWVSEVYYVNDGDSIESIAAEYGVDVSDIADLNGLSDPNNLEVGQRLLIPGSGDDALAAGSSSGDVVYGAGGSIPGQSGATAFTWVPTHAQERNLSCEYASAYIATSAFGFGISESVFLDAIPNAANPHKGYRGDIDGRWGNYTDYGIYPEPLVPVLNSYGFQGEVFYSEGDPSYLQEQLDAGHPVIVWLATWGDNGNVYDDDGHYTVFAGEHVVVAYAYDDNGVYVSDPAHGQYRHMTWSTFISEWSADDGMSLAVYPS